MAADRPNTTITFLVYQKRLVVVLGYLEPFRRPILFPLDFVGFLSLYANIGGFNLRLIITDRALLL